MKYDIQKFAAGALIYNLTIVWDDDNNKKKVRPKTIRVGEQDYAPQQETDSTWTFNFSNGVDFSTISLENFERNYDYVINPTSLAVGQDLTNKRIYMSPDYYGYYDNYINKWSFNFYRGTGYSDNVVDGFFDYLDGGTAGPGLNKAKTFLVGSKESLEAVSHHINGNYIDYVSSSSGLLENVENSVNGLSFTSSFFKGDLIGTINEIDETCPFLSIFQLEQGWDSDTIIKCKVRNYKNPDGFALNLTPEERNALRGIAGASIGNQRILEAKKGDTLIRTFREWREPKLGDNLNGQTIKIKYPSKPIYNTGYETSFLNNEYIVTDGDYMIRETGTYDQVDSASDYSWVIEDYIYSIEIYGRGSEGYFTEIINTIYKTTTRIKTTYGSGGNPTQQIQSQTVDIRKTEVVLPSDIGTFVSVTSNMGITFQVDDLRISTKSYSLQSLQGTDNLQNKMIFVSDFPTNIDKVWFPSPPSIDEYGRFDIPEQYTLLSAEKDFGNNGYYVYIISADMVPTYSDTGQASTPYYFVINGQNMGLSSTICSKQYGASEVGIWNAPIVPDQAPSSFTLAEAGLNTSSPLYPYIKKLVWDE